MHQDGNYTGKLCTRNFFFFITLKSRVERYKKSMSLKYEPSQPLKLVRGLAGESSEGRVAIDHQRHHAFPTAGARFEQDPRGGVVCTLHVVYAERLAAETIKLNRFW